LPARAAPTIFPWLEISTVMPPPLTVKAFPVMVDGRAACPSGSSGRGAEFAAIAGKPAIDPPRISTNSLRFMRMIRRPIEIVSLL
jgi:hypothetical protein